MRYPGGKSKLKKHFMHLFPEDMGSLEYREPFLGGGSVFLSLLEHNNLKSIWINDVDYSLSCLWTQIIQDPKDLVDLIEKFTPSLESYYDFQASLSDPRALTPLQAGFRKLAVHQMSYSGLGERAGGPIGGTTQSSKYAIGCRWSPDRLTKTINKISKLLSGARVRENRCTSYDFEQLISDNTTKAFLYLDPPYYDKGSALYRHSFSEQDHVRMAEKLRTTSNKWILSYDAVNPIEILYGEWANVNKFSAQYSITSVKEEGSEDRSGTIKSEFIILPKDTSI
jgi:DNA adenine methylase